MVGALLCGVNGQKSERHGQVRGPAMVKIKQGMGKNLNARAIWPSRGTCQGSRL